MPHEKNEWQRYGAGDLLLIADVAKKLKRKVSFPHVLSGNPVKWFTMKV
jgi:hypothetical protein